MFTVILVIFYDNVVSCATVSRWMHKFKNWRCFKYEKVYSYTDKTFIKSSLSLTKSPDLHRLPISQRYQESTYNHLNFFLNFCRMRLFRIVAIENCQKIFALLLKLLTILHYILTHRRR